jgi:hypothetical protein
MATYRVLVGIDYEGKRAEPGTVVSDLPAKSVTWLVAQNIIEATDNTSDDQPATSKTTAAREPKSPSKGGE